ncbi:2-hydroxyacylsphingosine 1-beta-galactosyltransferase [Blattella germanica]|nr:2-hydroxyacylsphingosine 1-beta-galactosyltransferase [Blattella germanica]
MYKKTEAEIDFEEFVEVSAISMMFTALEWATTLCELSLESTAAQQLMKSTEKFDLIITEATFTECLFGFIPKFGSPPVVALSAFGIPPWLIDLMGTPENPSYTPNSILPYTDHMTFFQRVHNTLITTILNINYRYSIIPHSEEVARKHFKTEQPSYVDVVKNFSFLLTNLVFGLDAARPLAPNVIPISGMHIKSKPDPLPEEIRKFLDGAKDGFIFFSLGTNVKSKALPKEKLRALLDAFAELPQRILWKFESDDLPGLPPNVMIGKWLPQSDILAHPNIRAFISHCGKVSTTESIYRGVPVVGVPFFADQWLNLQQMLAKGVAVNLDFVTLTKESTLTSIREILNNER